MIERTLDRRRHPAWYRVIVPAFSDTPLSGKGAARQGGRFNRPGQEALYLSLDEATALSFVALLDACVLYPAPIRDFRGKGLPQQRRHYGRISTHIEGRAGRIRSSDFLPLIGMKP